VELTIEVLGMLSEAVENDKPSHILKKAGKLFLERGFAGTSMGQIAAAGAGAKGTFYGHFRSISAVRNLFVPSRSSRSADAIHLHRLNARAEWRSVTAAAI
jgi:AcrR family transcriptional regulator